jgi:hypothetical protein
MSTPRARMLVPCTRMSRVKADQSARYGPDLVVCLAEQHEASIPPSAVGRSQSVRQRQQQVQPKTSAEPFDTR